MRLGVLPDPEATGHDVIEGYMEDAVGQVDIADLQRAQLTSARAGDRDQTSAYRSINCATVASVSGWRPAAA